MTDTFLRKTATREPGNPGEFGTHDHTGPEATLADVTIERHNNDIGATCGNCGEPLLDGEGYDGLCRECAGAASCSSCGGVKENAYAEYCNDCQAEVVAEEKAARVQAARDKAKAPKFASYQFDDSGYGGGTADKKARVANGIARFIEAGYPREKFTKSVYHALSSDMYLGFIAEYDIDGFYRRHFENPISQRRFLQEFAQGCSHTHGRADIWDDVKDAFHKSPWLAAKLAESN